MGTTIFSNNTTTHILTMNILSAYKSRFSTMIIGIYWNIAISIRISTIACVFWNTFVFTSSFCLNGFLKIMFRRYNCITSQTFWMYTCSSNQNYFNMIVWINNTISKRIIFFHFTFFAIIIIRCRTHTISLFFTSLLRWVCLKNMIVRNFHGVCNNNFRIQIVIVSYNGNFIIIINNRYIQT